MLKVFQRINDVVTANINDLIDRVEDPERMVKQIIREMEEHIRASKEGVLEAMTSEKKLHKEVEHHRHQSATWRQQAEDALRSGNENLSRAALVRKKEHDHILMTLEPAWEAAKQTSERLKTQLRSVELKLDEARRRRTMLTARQRAAEAGYQMDRTLNHLRDGLDAHRKLDRMEERVSDMEARTEAMSELNDEASRLSRDLRDLKIEQEVNDEFEALKKQIADETSSQP
jgi:phage shock protein A